MEDRKLFLTAAEARKNAYAKFSDFCVGAALLTGSGKVYTGVNVENSSYGATICAERTAFLKAISEGERDFIKLAVVAGEKGKKDFLEAVPCGICRQFMYEFNPEIEIVYGDDPDSLKKCTLEKLLPEGFRL